MVADPSISDSTLGLAQNAKMHHKTMAYKQVVIV